MDNLGENFGVEFVFESGEDSWDAPVRDGHGWISGDRDFWIGSGESRLLFQLTGECAIDSHGDG